MKKIALSILLFFSLVAVVWAGQVNNPWTGKPDIIPTITEEDASPKLETCRTLKFSNDSVTDNGDSTCSVSTGAGGGGAPTDATYIVQTADGTLSNEQAIGALSSGILRGATTTGVITSLGDVLPVANGGTAASSASITAFNNITGYTASGATGTTSTNLVFSASPTLTGSPVVGPFSFNSSGVSYTAGQTTGAIISLQGNSLTSGTGLTITSSGNSFTGDLIRATYSGTSSGSVIDITSSNASASGNVAEITNAGTGLTLLVEDVASDTTPFVIDEDGDVGIGNSAPASKLVVNPPAAETITAGATITVDACGTIKQITSSGAVTTGTTNTFTAPAAGNTGCRMGLCNVGSNNITLDSNANFVTIAGVDVVMKPNDCAIVSSNGTAWYQETSVSETGAICFHFGDASTNITTGEKKAARHQVKRAGKITGWTILSMDDTSSSITLDVWKDTYANYPPTVADTITASAKPAVSSDTKATSTTLTSWTTTFAAGDVFGVNVDANTAMKDIELCLDVTWN